MSAAPEQAEQSAQPAAQRDGNLHRERIDPRIVVGVVFVSSMFLSIIDSTIVNVALPTLSRQFKVPTSSIDAVVVGYLVSLAVFIPASGWLGDRFGTKRVFLFALSLFTIASALCGLSGSLNELILFRIIQGAGGGMLTPVGSAMLWRTFPPEQRVQASRILMIPTIVAPASGPIVGGFLVEKLSWHWAFFVNVPIGIATFLFAIAFLQEHREPDAGRFDLPGFLLAGAGFAMLMFAISEGPSKGWTAPLILGSGVLGLALLLVFVLLELRVKAPMVNLRLLRNRLFRTTNLVSMFSSAGFTGLLFLIPIFLQEARGDSALASGLTTFPEAIGVLVGVQIAARIYPTIGPRRLMASGISVAAVFMALLCLVGLHSSDWLVRLLLFLTGSGMAFSFLSSQAAAFATISSADTGQAATLASVQRQLGSATGVAILSTVVAAIGPVLSVGGTSTGPNLHAYNAAFLTAAILALIAATIALTIPDRDAAATMKRSGKDADADALPPALEVAA